MAKFRSQQPAPKAANPPVMRFHAGGVEASIWENTNDKGTWYNITVRKSYKDDKDQWQESSSFGTKDALALAGILQAAAFWIMTTENEARAAAAGNGQPF